MRVKKDQFDFGGWASKNNLRCADGRVIRQDAFAANDGQIVPLIYGHNHDDPSAVIGHALLENRDEGVYAWGSFNGTQKAKDAKEALLHGDLTALSIWANNLEQVGRDVIHGAIREVSLVLAGANPGAFVESILQHGEPMDDDDTEGIFYTNEKINILSHADDTPPEPPKKEEGNKGAESDDLAEIYNSFTPKQKEAVAAIVAGVLEDEDSEGEGSEGEDGEVEHGIDDNEEGNIMHHVFENQGAVATGNYLSHDDMAEIFKTAKKCGSLKDAVADFAENHEFTLQHAVPTDGMEVPTGTQNYGFRDPEMLLPDYKALSNQPDFISRNMDWVSDVIGGVKKVPFARIKTLHADITEDEARAKGYIKGNQKKEEVFTLLKRTTDPQTIYKKQKLDKDDIYDITDFDIVLWLKAEMQVMLDEELARAILIGDGRPADSEDKIKEDHIRPIATDVDLYNVKVQVAKGADDTETSKNIINSVIKSRKNYKGSGNPVFYTTEDVLTDILLMENKIGEKIYKTEGEVATALRVSKIVTVEPMEDHKVNGADLVGVIVNLMDYALGNNKPGLSNDVFEDFDIDYNQYKYLMEKRVSGALIKPFSAITVTMGGASGASIPQG